MTRLAILLYLPPPEVANSEPFMANLAENEPSFRIEIISDSPKWWPARRIEKPIQRKSSSYETSLPIFDEVMKHAASLDSEYIMILEPDCRVKGKHWDVILLAEALAVNSRFLLAGTPVAFHTHLAGPEIRAKTDGILNAYNLETGSRIYPLQDEWIPRTEWAFFPNGAMAIYRRQDALRAWNTRTHRTQPWDMILGMELARTHGAADYLKGFVPMPSALSFNGECFISRQYQKDQLTSGRVYAIHNIKDKWVP